MKHKPEFQEQLMSLATLDRLLLSFSASRFNNLGIIDVLILINQLITYLGFRVNIIPDFRQHNMITFEGGNQLPLYCEYMCLGYGGDANGG